MSQEGKKDSVRSCNVFIDARMGSNPGGIARYVNSLVGQYAKMGYEFDLVYLKEGNRYTEEGLKTTSVGIPTFSLREQLILPVYFRGADLLHCPNFNVPLGYTGKLVVTIHDLTLIKFPSLLPNRLVHRWVRFLMGRAVSRADRVIAVSKNTRKDLLNEFDVREDKVTVIYNGLSEAFSEEPANGGGKVLKGKYNLPEEYILSLGNLKPHKNLSRMIKAVKEAGPELGDFGLVITGKGEVKTRLEKEIMELGISNKVVFTGYVDDSDLPSLYREAKLFVYPSIYEGFGFPPLEAMASGTAVVTSNAASIPEIVGDAALLVNPKRIESIAEGISKLWNDPDLRRKYVSKGLKRVESFSWEKCASKTLSVYEQVLSGNN